jgi:midasin
LKAILEPQQVASYQGDYKTGKKLNMRKIIPFIASKYRKDRIWLRRAEPTDRNYQILIGIDDTKSMGINEVGRKALEGSFALAFALAKLNIKIGISRMRDRMSLLHGF